MKPLAENLRPQVLDDFFGQSHLLNDTHPLKQAIDRQQLHSMILWGPSGTGKTTLARIIASQVDGHFAQMSAVLDGVKELRAVVKTPRNFKILGKKLSYLLMKYTDLTKHSKTDFCRISSQGLLR